MRVVSHLVVGGALHRHPSLKLLIAEGGAGWVPALGDRLDEAYRQHDMFARQRLNRLPSEIMRQEVYASFQHDVSAVQISEDTGYSNVVWGYEYPHLEVVRMATPRRRCIHCSTTWILAFAEQVLREPSKSCSTSRR
ncbi:hypothetical protein [Mycobacterium xenopi]|uniref:Amidohydrolase n=1 Tax=Mycobacterium xenopi TaxID=1789 RepID=A0AAD1GY83_MYCXE|nr:hypothetical protein MYXE_07790 [Mycobacterium xenopi]SPX79105.1 amidohydrolase 2 [Mycobacterium xenopi]